MNREDRAALLVCILIMVIVGACIAVQVGDPAAEAPSASLELEYIRG